jgi:hypothetical protein
MHGIGKHCALCKSFLIPVAACPPGSTSHLPQGELQGAGDPMPVTG